MSVYPLGEKFVGRVPAAPGTPHLHVCIYWTCVRVLMLRTVCKTELGAHKQANIKTNPLAHTSLYI